MNMQLRPPITRVDISGLCPTRVAKGPMNLFTHSSTFWTRVRDSEMRDVSCWAFLNSSITSTSEADLKAALSPSERLTSSSIFATAFSNASFLDGAGTTTEVEVLGLEEAGLTPLDDWLRRMDGGIREPTNPLNFSRFRGGMLFRDLSYGGWLYDRSPDVE